MEDKSGNLWIGTNGGGLLYFDRAANTYTRYLHDPSNRNSISSNVIVSLLIDREGKLWIGTYFGGLDCFDGSGRPGRRSSQEAVEDPGSADDRRGGRAVGRYLHRGRHGQDSPTVTARR